jgi:hypothetical protein
LIVVRNRCAKLDEKRPITSWCMLVACRLVTVARNHTRLTPGLTLDTRGTIHSTSKRIVDNGVEFAPCATGSAHFAEGIMDDNDSFRDKCIQRNRHNNNKWNRYDRHVNRNLAFGRGTNNLMDCCAFFKLELVCVIPTTRELRNCRHPAATKWYRRLKEPTKRYQHTGMPL